MRRAFFGCLFLALLALISATSAKADDVFSWTLPGTPDPSSPSFTYTANYSFTITGVPVTGNGTPLGDFTFDFYDSLAGGGFDAFSGLSMPIFNEFGSQIFSGPTADPESAPTFLTGTFYDFMGTGTLTNGATGTLNISDTGNGDLFTYTVSSTPEPGSLLLIGTGLLPFIGLLRKRASA